MKFTKSRVALPLLVSSTLLSVPPSGAAIAPPLSAAKLMSTIEAGKIRSIEELLPLLPEENRKYLVLMRESRSLHLATPERPRAVLYSKDARFILAFSGAQEDPARDSLEIVEFNDARRAFDYSAIHFGGQRPRLERDASRCVGCHGTDPRPIWDPYRTWRGAYGEKEDAMAGEELAQFQRFLGKARDDARYRHLIIAPTGSGYYLPGSYGYPNIVFGSRVARLNALRVARLMKQSPAYEKYKHAVAHASVLGNCNQNLPRQVLAEAEREYQARLGADPAFRARYETDSPRTEKALLYRLLDVDPVQELRLDHSPRTPFRSEDAYDEFDWNAGGDSMGDLAEFAILKDLLDSDEGSRRALAADLGELGALFDRLYLSDASRLEEIEQDSYYETILPYLRSRTLPFQVGSQSGCDHLAAAAVRAVGGR